MGEEKSAAKHRGREVLTIDIGGSRVKMLVRGAANPRKAPTGPDFTPDRLMSAVRTLARGWRYDAVSIGFPGMIGDGGPKAETRNLGRGWVGFDYPGAFGRPVRWANDAAMQALGSYEGGRMLFFGLGTGLGSALVIDRTVLGLELGDLPFNGKSLGQTLGRDGFRKLGKKKWRKILKKTLPTLQKILVADYIVIGGGNSRHLDTLPAGVRIGNNFTAFRGGERMWDSAGSEDEPYWTFF